MDSPATNYSVLSSIEIETGSCLNYSHGVAWFVEKCYLVVHLLFPLEKGENLFDKHKLSKIYRKIFQKILISIHT